MKTFIISLLMLLLLLTVNCATVKPWQREYLADPIMSLDDSWADGWIREIAAVREASDGGYAGSGGGCGCN